LNLEEDWLAKVLLHSVALTDAKIDPWYQGGYRLFTQSAQEDVFGVHQLTVNPSEAEVILFTELGGQGMFSELVRRDPYMKQYREKCFLFDPGDYALPFLPGIYASLRKTYYDPARTRTGYYLRLDENPYIEFRVPQANPKYLGCFVGSLENHPMRAALAHLPSDRFLIEDTSKFSLKMLVGGEEQDRHRFWSHYADAIDMGAFSLCPRGRGPGSIRLFESMRMGRCPVIVSDEWVFPDRVDWSGCSITVAEKDVMRLPEILAANIHRAAEMGLRARQEWERIYAPNVRFHWLVEDCIEMLHARETSETIAGWKVWRHLFDDGNFRRYLISKKQLYKQFGRILL
jgi:exostosin family protein